MTNTVAEPLAPERLIELLTEQRDLYRRLRMLGARQRAQITGDRGDHLLKTLEERAVLVNELVARNQLLGPYLQKFDALSADFPEALRARTAELLREVTGLVGTILNTDEADGALLAARAQAIAAERREVFNGRTAHAAYVSQSGGVGAAVESDLRA
jgi:hypothetical protein